MDNPLCVPSMAAVQRWFERARPRRCYDVGAHLGGLTEFMLSCGAGHVVAFEPLPPLFAKLQARFGTDARVTLHNLAVGACCEFRHGMRVKNCYTLTNRDTLDDSPEFAGKHFDVQFTALDNLRDWPDFIKLDADGYEPAILRGADDLIRAARPAIMLELSYIPLELGDSCDLMVYRLYHRHQYRFVSMDGSYVCPDHRTALKLFPWLTSYDVLAVPVEKLEVLF